MAARRTFQDQYGQRIPFGKPMLEAFCMDPGYINLNATSCGSWPKAVSDKLKDLWAQLEAQPDLFSGFSQGPVLQEARLGIAQLVHAAVSECVLISNATTGIFTVLYNYPFEAGDVVLTLSTTYGAIDNAITSLAETRPLQARKVEFEFPTTHQDIVSRFEAAIAQIKAEGLRPRLAVLETVVSIPAVRMPFEELVRVCQREGVMTLVDGAHSVGQFEVNLDELQPDFFTAECHKWLFVPRPCAFLYVAQRNQHLFRSTIPTSFGFIPRGGQSTLPLWSQMVSADPATSPFETLFAYTATSDNMPHMCIPTALRFRQDICGGEVAIYEYVRWLAKEGGDRVASILETEVLEEPDIALGAHSQMRNCGIATVRLPLRIATGDSHSAASVKISQTHALLAEEQVGPAVRYLTKCLSDTYRTWLPFIDYKGWIWARICAQIYLEVSDFEFVGHALKILCEKIAKGEVGPESQSNQ
ncbi:pyridoxal phosphate-dependent transferase [Daldinia vernicosa]|uniref:pyridoxal phosphate-dependent transferase n=1 Tax=Daldinia vernicosa TaxID=114800 RepID=UPI002008E33B|nr:pyridoxal phosphate-dependent transferase [Daldinia vernicosa]KAI0845505.1 pyridoxal phosphate-dependent transferase [Daldinia vernicosa]